MATYEIVVCDPNAVSADKDLWTIRLGGQVGDTVCRTSTGVSGFAKTRLIDIPAASAGSQSQAMTDAVNRLANVAETIFQLPDTPTDFAAAFGAGFILPCTLYLIAHAVGVPVNFWRK